MNAHLAARHISVSGVVQGVGFRPFVFRLATELELAGWVVNSTRGVTLEVEGPPAQLRRFLVRLRSGGPWDACAVSDSSGVRG